MLRVLAALISICISYHSMHAQCGQGTASVTLRGAHHTLKLRNDGSLISGADGPGWLLQGEDGVERSLFDRLNLWIMGSDCGGTRKGVATSSPETEIQFNTGPLTEIGTQVDTLGCDWDQIWTVTNEDIGVYFEAFDLARLRKSQGGSDTIEINRADHPAIYAWPGRGNRYFKEIHGFDLPFEVVGLAPFFDMNGNNRYEPDKGDYPTIKCAEEAAWWVMNTQNKDATNPILMRFEVQVLALVGREIGEELFHRTSLIDIKVINRAFEVIDTLAFGVHARPALGDPTDDFIGTSIDSRSMFVYNGDEVDGPGDCADPSHFCADHPIVGISSVLPLWCPKVWVGDQLVPAGPCQKADTFVQKRVDHIIAYPREAAPGIPGMLPPSNPEEYRNYLNGVWQDGTPLSYGGTGYNLGGQELQDFIFSDNPADEFAWNLCTQDFNEQYDMVMSVNDLKLDPTRIHRLSIALHHTFPSEASCPDIGRFDEEMRSIEQVSGLYSNVGPCGRIEYMPPSSTSPTDPVNILPYPNPSSDIIQFEDLSQPNVRLGTLRLYDVHGRLVDVDYFNEWRIGVYHRGALPAGVYFYTLEVIGLEEPVQGKLVFR